MSCPSESSVGWFSGRCGVDFTVAFEVYVLVIVPAGSFLLLSPFRVSTLWARRTKVSTPTALQHIKMLIGFLFVGSSFSLLITDCVRSRTIAKPAEITGAIFNLFAAVVATVLSQLEHTRSIRPSKLLQLYLLIALVVECVHLRTIWRLRDSNMLRVFGIFQVVCCAAFLAVESTGKERMLLDRQKRSPQDVTGLFSERLFWWLNRLFVKGYTTILQPVDLGPSDEDLSSPEADRKFRLEWLKHFHRNPKVSLARVCLAALRFDALFPIIPRSLLVATTFAQPYLILRLVSYLEQPTKGSPGEGALLVIATAVTYIAVAVFTSWYWQSVSRALVKLRGCLTTALHDKALRSRSNSSSSSLTLMNVDVERVLLGIKFIHEFWSTALTAGISLALLYIQLGIAFIAPLMLLVVLILFSSLNGTNVIPRQKLSFEATQERITYITSVVASMRNIKLLGISSSVLTRGTKFRDIEVDAQRAMRTALLLNFTISLSTYQLSSLVLYAAFAIKTYLGGDPLTTARLFTSLSILKLFTTPLLGTIQFVPMTMQSFVSLQRIQDYLTTENHSDNRTCQQEMIDADRSNSASILSNDHLARLTSVYAGYSSSSNVLTQVSCEFSRGTLSMVVGPVGCGKSTLLKTILGETCINGGTISADVRDAAYCSQPPWLWNASIKENICGISEYDEQWFIRVTWACALHEDIIQFAQGIQTKVGSGGTTLSGGQKNRLCLARALYSRKRLVILDDILSGLDPRTESLVFTRALGPKGLFKEYGCCVVFATHAVAWTRFADQILSLDMGVLACQKPSVRSSSPTDTSDLDAADTATQTGAGEHIWTQPTNQDLQPEPARSLVTDRRVYKKYLSSFGWTMTTVYIVGCALYAGSSTVQSLWLTWWAAAAPTGPEALGRYVGTFTGITIGCVIVITAWITFSMLILTPRSSRYLHLEQWSALVNVLYTAWGPIDTGNVINRFSQDISIIDERLSIEFINLTALIFLCLASGSLVIVATPYIAAALPLVAVIFWAIQKVYLRTSKQLRAMDLEAKAPLCTYFLETTSGIETIKAYGWVDSRREMNARLITESQVPFYLLETVQNWLALVLNLVVAGIAIVVVALAVKLSNSVGYIGLALVQIMDLGGYCQRLIVNWTGLETSLGAVARLIDFIDAMPGEASGQFTPPLDWPSRGCVEIEHLTASYSDLSTTVLKDVDIKIDSGSKVAICGRTGSGKSSLGSAIFGLLHFVSGSIKIDGVDISKLQQDLLRSRMVAIPQEPYFTPGTIRDNLDLVKASSIVTTDEAMISALKDVRLYEKFKDFALVSQEPELSLLDMELDPMRMLTTGQMQLFAMARAILTKGRIVLVDEASSGLDNASEAIVQELLRRNFANRTVIVIAHHLHTIMDFDTVIVLDKGQVAEFGQPMELATRKDSLFGRLLRASD